MDFALTIARIIVLVTFAGVGLPALRAAPLRVMVPAYFYPLPAGSPWDELPAAARQVPLVAILNPDSGPGTFADPNYLSALAALHAASGRVIGYVPTGYTSRSLQEVEADVQRYLEFYPVDGFFIDEMTNDGAATHLAYYGALYSFIKARNAEFFVTGNPGANTLESYLTPRATADALVLFESGTGYQNFTPSAWVSNYLARQFVNLPYAISSATAMTNAVLTAAAHNTGFLYVTSDGAGGANPWDSLPSYWREEIDLIRAFNESVPPTRLEISASPPSGLPVVQINGAPGVYELQASTDLRNWSPISTNNTSGPALNFIDLKARDFTARFFRTVQ